MQIRILKELFCRTPFCRIPSDHSANEPDERPLFLSRDMGQCAFEIKAAWYQVGMSKTAYKDSE